MSRGRDFTGCEEIGERTTFGEPFNLLEIWEALLKPFTDGIRAFFGFLGVILDLIWFCLEWAIGKASDFSYWLAQLLEPIVQLILGLISIGLPLFFVLGFLGCMLEFIFSETESESSKKKKAAKNLIEYFSCLTCEYLEIVEQSYFIPNHGTKIEHKSYCRLLDEYVPKLEACSEHLAYSPKLEN